MIVRWRVEEPEGERESEAAAAGRATAEPEGERESEAGLAAPMLGGERERERESATTGEPRGESTGVAMARGSGGPPPPPPPVATTAVTRGGGEGDPPPRPRASTGFATTRATTEPAEEERESDEGETGRATTRGGGGASAEDEVDGEQALIGSACFFERTPYWRYELARQVGAARELPAARADLLEAHNVDLVPRELQALRAALQQSIQERRAMQVACLHQLWL